MVHIFVLFSVFQLLCLTAIFLDGCCRLQSELDLRSLSNCEAWSTSLSLEGLANTLSTSASRIHRPCSGLDANVACCHISSLLKTPGGKFGLALNNNRWFGVRGSRSFGSLLPGVNGLRFKIPSTSLINVGSVSSETSCCPSSALKILRTDLIVRSHV